MFSRCCASAHSTRRAVVDGCSRASSSSASRNASSAWAASHRLQSSSRVRGPEYAGATKHSRRRVEGRAHQRKTKRSNPPLSIIVSHEAQDRTVKLTVAGKTAVVGRRGLSRYLALSTVSVLRHVPRDVHRCTSTHPPAHPVTAHRSPAPPPPGPGRPAPGAAPVAKKWVVCPDSHAIEKWTSSR